MRISVLAVTASLALAAACAPSRPDVEPDGEVLRARLDRTSSGLAVGMSEPGHVAVFAIQPGFGTAMVYPTRIRPSRVGGGWTNLFPLQRRYRAEGLARGGNTGLGYLVLVASREPLDVEAFIENATRLREVLGPESLLAYQHEAVVERIGQVIAAGRGEDDWELDVLTVPSYALGAPESTPQSRF